jgi:putative nucleotide binding protein
MDTFPHRKFEEYAYILDYIQNGKSSIVRMREGIIIHAIGEEHLTILELLGMKSSI